MQQQPGEEVGLDVALLALHAETLQTPGGLSPARQAAQHPQLRRGDALCSGASSAAPARQLGRGATRTAALAENNVAGWRKRRPHAPLASGDWTGLP